MNKQSTSSLIMAALLVIIAALSRVIMYPDNFSPIIGMAIFAGAVIKDRRLAFALPLFAMILSDVMFEVFNITTGFWGWGQLVGYGILALITILAFTMKKINVLTVAGYSVGASLLFFFLSNSSFFIFDNPIYKLYPQNFGGYVDSLAGGLPFLRTGIVADLVYSTILFGTYFLMQKYAFNKKAVA
ncbi:MAG TPA: DUF6580 family putative transport protein [Ferruginibacter sp.]|nr:DUF6580 family putative transport protein [Ferruginibacter sp.]